MKRNSFYTAAIIFVLLAITAPVKSQVAINTDGAAPNSSAMLDVVSSDKGILIPRMTNVEIGGITPTNGLLVYSTDDNTFYYYNNSTWVQLSSGASGQWTVSGFDIFYDSGSVGIGTSAPDGQAILDISSTTKGLLIPRMTSSERTSMMDMPQGLIVYQTDGITGLYFYQGTRWRYIQRSSFTTLSGNTTLSDSHDIVLCNGTFTVALPAASSHSGRIYFVKNIGTGTITIDPNGLELIDGQSVNYLLSPKRGIQIISNGTAWFILSEKSTQYASGALTDGAPTAAQLNTATGSTPSNSRTSGTSYIVKDSDGSGLLYLVESDGTSWYYTTMTRAL